VRPASRRRVRNAHAPAATAIHWEKGFEEALRRGNAFAEAGADVVFIEAPQSVDEQPQPQLWIQRSIPA